MIFLKKINVQEIVHNFLDFFRKVYTVIKKRIVYALL